jgi:hopanoid biosynthesis associated protein HpnK
MAAEVNEAVEIAHRDGILSATSLMVSGLGAADAVARARRLPSLRVGLHLVLVDGVPTLPPERLPDLVGDDGRFRTDIAKLGFDIFTRLSARRQMVAEIEAQFAAYRATGLPLDHVNAHRHFHLHPSIASAILAAGKRYGMTALRVPLEPRAVLAKVQPAGRAGVAWISAPWIRMLGTRARRVGLRTPDAVFGLAWSGAMTAERVEGVLRMVPEGRTEIYFHPAIRNDFPGHAPGYRYVEELTALTAPGVIAMARRGDVTFGGYADF